MAQQLNPTMAQNSTMAQQPGSAMSNTAQPLEVPTMAQSGNLSTMTEPLNSTVEQTIGITTVTQPGMAQAVTTMAQPSVVSAITQQVAASTIAQSRGAARSLCLVCEGQGTTTNHSLLLSAGNENLKNRIEYILGVTVTLVTSNHSALCEACGGKLEQVGRLLKDMRLSYNKTLEKYGVTSVTGLLTDYRLWSTKQESRSHTQLVTTSSNSHMQLSRLPESDVPETANQESGNIKPVEHGIAESDQAAKTDTAGDVHDELTTASQSSHGRGKPKNMTSQHDDPDKMECVTCNIVFTRRSTYRHHLKMHNEGSGHSCCNCAMVLPSVKALRVHKASRCNRARSKVKQPGGSEATPQTRSRSSVTPQMSRSNARAVTRSRSEVTRSCQAKTQKALVKSELPKDDMIEAEEGTEPKRRKRGRPRKHWPVPAKDAGMKEVDEENCDDSSPQETSQDTGINELCERGGDSVGCKNTNENKSTKTQIKAKRADHMTQDVRHQCGVCGREFTHGGTLRRHMRTHSDLKPFTCDQCPAAFKWAQALSTHLRTHTGAKPFSCTECPKTFRQLGTLRSHLSSHRGEKNYQCNICQSAFTRAMRLRIHMRTHTGERPYRCDRCGEGFADPQIYRKHVRLHTGEKPYKCVDCGAAFVMARYLTEHRKIHTGERRYLCAICGMAFANSGRLKRHSVTHTGIKPFKCNDCGRFFAHNGDLKIHRRIHSGEKPYLCPVCGKAFTHHAGMSQHLVVHTGEKKFACQLCDARFASRGKLKRHTLMHPKEQRVAALGIDQSTRVQLQGQPSSEVPQEHVIAQLQLATNIQVGELSKDNGEQGELQNTSMIIGAMESVDQSEEIVGSAVIPDFVNVLQTATPGEEYHVQAVLPPTGNVVFQGTPGQILTLNFE